MSQEILSREITLLDLLRVLARRYKLVLTCTLLATAIAAAAALSVQPIYRAEALVAPVKADSASSGLGALSGQLGGLASLAGLSLGDSGSKEVEALATLKSRALIEAMVTEHELMPVLFKKKWDVTKKQWKVTGDDVPTLWDAYEVMETKIRQVSEDKKTGLVTISVEWTDPALAREWVNDLIHRTNQLLRSRAISRSERNIAYLHKQLEQTSVIELRQAIYRLLENEIKTVMVAQGSDEYAFKLIDPAVIPEEKVWPKRVVWVALGLFAGLVSSCLFALIFPAPPRTMDRV